MRRRQIRALGIRFRPVHSLLSHQTSTMLNGPRVVALLWAVVEPDIFGPLPDLSRSAGEGPGVEPFALRGDSRALPARSGQKPSLDCDLGRSMNLLGTLVQTRE